MAEATVALSTYLAGRGLGTLSAFVSNLPLLTGLTFLLIRAEGGSDAVREYARGLLIFTPPLALLCGRGDGLAQAVLASSIALAWAY